MDSRSRDTTYSVAEGPDRILFPDDTVIYLPRLSVVVEQAKGFGWKLWPKVDPSVGQIFRTHCNHGRSSASSFVDSPFLTVDATLTVVELQGSTMHYTPATVEKPVMGQDTLKAHIWRGRCYDCGNRHMGFNNAQTWVMGLNVVRYAVETQDENLMDWLRQDFRIWRRWIGEAPPAQLAQNLISWAREDIDRYG